MKIRIEHDGSMNTHKTRITNADTGEELERVSQVELNFNAGSGPIAARLTVYAPILDLIVDAEIKHVCPCCGHEVIQEKEQGK